jgi:5-methylcytosine-specific restriction enzyme subunit McrC
VDGSSFEPGRDGLTVVGFVINMAKVFEDFVCVALGNELRQIHGRTGTQVSTYLDHDQEVRMRPDLVWYADDGSPCAVVDAKYKAEKPSGFPDADLYQMLAYCTALNLPIGHLVYAKGNEHGCTHHVLGADVVVRAHTLDLDRPPTAVLHAVSHLAETISTTVCSAAASSIAAAQA